VIEAAATGEEGPLAWRVVVNHEGQCSLWPADRPAPPGWADVGRGGAWEECLACIREVWHDLRPLSLRNADRESRALVAAREFMAGQGVNR
jgi:MbtH protein